MPPFPMLVLANSVYLWWLAQVLAIAILVYFFLRWKPKFTGGRTINQLVGSMLDARQSQIEAQLESAEKSRQEAARTREASQQEVEQARVEAETIATRAVSTAEAIGQEIEQRAQEEYQRIIAQARVEIDLERERAELALRRRAADLVVDAAGKVVENHLDPSTDVTIIDRSLVQMKDLE
ncbi:MAG: F0F1 ATP synthase subunit B [Chloroflexota bacterium]